MRERPDFGWETPQFVPKRSKDGEVRQVGDLGRERLDGVVIEAQPGQLLDDEVFGQVGQVLILEVQPIPEIAWKSEHLFYC